MSTLQLWNVLEDDDQGEVLHVVPLTDARAHVATVRCSCNPTRQRAYGGAYVHNSLAEPQQIH